MTRLFSLFAVAVFAPALLSGCLSQAICAKVAECSSDPPGEDFERICQIQYDGQLRSLRVNKEDECHELAAAQEAYDACRSQLDCNDFEEADLNGECDDERDDYFDALDDADNECRPSD
jgi:hypothetical protein